MDEDFAKKMARRRAKSENGGGSVGTEQGTPETRSGHQVSPDKHTHTHKHTRTSHCFTIPENRCVAFSCSLKYTQTQGQKKVEEGASVSEERAKKLARRRSSCENGGGSVGIDQGTQETLSRPEVTN